MVTLNHKNILMLEKRGKVQNWSLENSSKFQAKHMALAMEAMLEHFIKHSGK